MGEEECGWRQVALHPAGDAGAGFSTPSLWPASRGCLAHGSVGTPQADLQTPALCPAHLWNWGPLILHLPLAEVNSVQSLPLHEPLAMTSDLTTPRSASL